MRCSLGLLTLASALAAGMAANAAWAADADSKGTVITLDGMKSATPATWKEETPSSSMRMAQLRLPSGKEGKGDAELVIFGNFGGSVKQNVERWKMQWKPAEGKKLDDVAKVEEIMIGGRKATVFQVEGTYLPPAFNPTYKGKPQPEFKMIAVQLEGRDTPYHVIVTGPAKTIDQHKKGFDDWLKGFK